MVVLRKTLLGLALLASATAFADSLPIRPGNWESIVQVANPFMPQPQEHVSVNCIKSNEYDPRVMMQAQQQTGCQIQDLSVAGNRVTWKLECQNPMNPGSPMRGEGEAQVQGDMGNGRFTMSMEVPGMGPGTFTTSWVTRRIGDC